MPSIITSVTIDAPPSVVREVFIDFSSYPQWNPFLKYLETPVPNPPPGTRIKASAGGTTFTPLIEENTPERFSWIGVLLAGWIFAGCHIFEFQPFGDIGENGESKGCKFVQSEIFSGILSWILFQLMATKVEKGFKEMNEALKVRVEEFVQTK
jgi:hypothetical protein